MTKGEPYLENIDSKEIKKLVHRLYRDQPDQFENREADETIMRTQLEKSKKSMNHGLTQEPDSHDYIASEIDKLLEDSTTLDQHVDSSEPEPSKASLPEFPASEKPKKIEKPKRPEKKRGFFGFFKK
ncbi:MAG: hypothetical protein KGY65_02940 [Candidatus Thermoplasmatota archaeon]|nr:hypothetical protein [Candidatus Thermoplasmatota archaeon]